MPTIEALDDSHAEKGVEDQYKEDSEALEIIAEDFRFINTAPTSFHGRLSDYATLMFRQPEPIIFMAEEWRLNLLILWKSKLEMANTEMAELPDNEFVTGEDIQTAWTTQLASNYLMRHIIMLLQDYVIISRKAPSELEYQATCTHPNCRLPSRKILPRDKAVAIQKKCILDSLQETTRVTLNFSGMLVLSAEPQGEHSLIHSWYCLECLKGLSNRPVVDLIIKGEIAKMSAKVEKRQNEKRESEKQQDIKRQQPVSSMDLD